MHLWPGWATLRGLLVSTRDRVQPSLAMSCTLQHSGADNSADTDVRLHKAAASSLRQDKLFGLWTRLFLFRTGLLSLN